MATRKPGKGVDQENPVYAKLFGGALRKGQRRKIEIIEACIATLAESGMAGTNYETVAVRLGIGRSHVAYHYPDFRALIEDAIRYITETAQAIVVERVARDEGDAAAMLRAYVSGNFDWAERHPEQLRIMALFFHLSSYDDGFRVLHARMKDSGIRRLKALIEAVREGARKGSRREHGQAAESLARVLHNAIAGSLLSIACAGAPARALRAELSELADSSAGA